ncbi:MAG: tetratricopeptide repeat protein [Nitrospirae bacterium]|nr:tetratricopeptide repeat protein [Nitrospirota bacterium]
MGWGKLNRLSVLVIGAALFFSSSFAHATEATYEQHIAKGIASVEGDNYSVAIDEFSAALREKPGDFRATLYLGIAQSRSGAAEAEATLKRARSMRPDDPRAGLELGIFNFNRSFYNVATYYFDDVKRIAPNSEFSRKADDYLAAISESKAAKRWLLRIAVGGQYDSNVVLNTAEGPLPQGISNKSDWRAVVTLNGRYDFVRAGEGSASIGYNFYQSLHAKLSDFNVSQHILDLSGTYHISPTFDLQGTYAFEYTFVGGDGYDYAHSLMPSLVVTEGKGFSTTVSYMYRRNHYMNSDLFFDNSDRSGSYNQTGVVQNIPLYGNIALAKLGYFRDNDGTRQAVWDYNGQRVIAALQFALPQRILIDLSAEYYRKHYKGAFVDGGPLRRDLVRTASISVTKLLSERYSITAGEFYTRNKSNTPEFDYTRAVTSLFLTARF